jgi:hypothetical protein
MGKIGAQAQVQACNGEIGGTFVQDQPTPLLFFFTVAALTLTGLCFFPSLLLVLLRM